MPCFFDVLYNHNLLYSDLSLQKACLSTILLSDTREITHGQLCELLKYAVLGKSSVPKPRYEKNINGGYRPEVSYWYLEDHVYLTFFICHTECPKFFFYKVANNLNWESLYIHIFYFEKLRQLSLWQQFVEAE